MRGLIVVLLSLALAACGFQLRGSQVLPFNTLFIGAADTSELYAQIRRSVEAGTTTRIVSDAREAEATLNVLGDGQQKNILSLDASGRVREFQLVRTFSFRLADAKNQELIATSRIVILRDISFSDSQVLSKETEEALLWRDMQSDLVQQLLRRLAAAKPKST